MWQLCVLLLCCIVSVFCGNYTFYQGNAGYPLVFLFDEHLRISTGFAHKVTNQTITNQTISTCVCQCLLNNGCAALTFYDVTQNCSLVYSTVITESDVNVNSAAKLLLITANLSYT